jgi:glycerate-2-kinase
MGYIKNYSELSLNKQRGIVLDLVEAAIDSIQPKNVLNKNFVLKDSHLTISDKEINLKDYERVFLLGFGKGSAGISQILEETLGNFLTKGFVIDTVPATFKKIEFTLGTHPLPSKENLQFTKKAIKNLSNLTHKDLVLIVICGGGSVLFEAPYNISFEKLVRVNQALLLSGATITEMNAVRKHLSKVKGGGLAKILSPAKVFSLIFSDVPGNDLSTIASGTTVKDNTSVNDAWKVYEKYGLQKLELKEKDFVETPKEASVFDNIQNILMLSNLTALNAMVKKAESMNIKTEVFSDRFESEARLGGKGLIEKTREHSILLAGGETTVKVMNPQGKGGRNQELVLSSLYHLDKDTTIAAFDSDGWDNSPVAGAIGDLQTLEKAKSLGLNPHEYLNENNSLVFFKNLRDAIVTDRLPSNVADLIIVYKK